VNPARPTRWTVPVEGVNGPAGDGLAQLTPCPDGSITMLITCIHNPDYRRVVRLDVAQAASLSTSIWEAAQAAQRLAHHRLPKKLQRPDDHPMPPPTPPRPST
jgi:hypothetical protein